MTPIETLALIAMLVIAIKLIVILVKPKAWADLVKKIWANPVLMEVIVLILATITLYYLLQELTIVQIFTVILFIALVAATSIAAYSKEMIALSQKMLKDKNIAKKAWLSILIWIILILWGLKELFM